MSWTGAAFSRTTWLILASDHGESFGEHAGVFCHGSSLYDTELHVPLLSFRQRDCDKASRQRDGQSARHGGDDRRRAGMRPVRHFPEHRWPVLEANTGARADHIQFRACRGRSHGPAPSRLLEFANSSLATGGNQATKTGRTFAARATPVRSCSTCARPQRTAKPRRRSRRGTTLEEMRSLLGRLTAGPLLPLSFGR